MLAVGGSSVNATAGNHTISAPLILGTSTTFNVSSGAGLHVTALQSTGVGVTKSGAGTLQLASLSAGAVSVTQGKLAFDAGVSAARRVSSLSVAAGAALDLADGKLIVTGSSTGAVSDLVKAGRNGGAWNGTGGVNTAAASGSLTALGVATAAQAGYAGKTFGGVSVSGAETLVMYTYAGDANLDGKINIDDYGRIDTSIGVASSGWFNGDFNYDGKINVDDYGRIDFNVNLGTAGWFNGDFNYDGKINVDDYGIIDFNVGIQGAPFATAGGLGSSAAVPEPATGALMFAAAAAVCAWTARRRRATSCAVRTA